MIDTTSFRHIMGCFATGITVVTALDADTAPVGITINSFTSVSLDPALILFCLDNKAHIFPLLEKADRFAINILADDQEDISKHFADYRRNPEPKKTWDDAQENCPVLQGTLGWMVCKKFTTYKGGDHTIIVGEVIKLMKRDTRKNPLLYFHSAYRTMTG